MARKKKVKIEPYIIEIAKRYNQGFYGNGPMTEKRINKLGYGNIFTKVKNCANLILTNKVK